MRSQHLVRLAAALLGPLAGGACLKVPQESASLSAMDATEVTTTELQMRVYEAGRRISWIIEHTADTIAYNTNDPDIRRNTLRWKLGAIPLVEEASLRADPVVAAVDLWAFTMQLSDFLRRGQARDAFGEFQLLAIAATDSLERIAGEVAGRLRPGGTPTAEDEQAIRNWARQHPMQGKGLGRESILSTNWKVLSITETSLTGTVASVQRSLGAVTNRLGYLNKGIFKRVLWQAELAARDMAPTLAAETRETLDSILAGQKTSIFGAITEQRVASFHSIAGERVAVLDGIRGERREVLEAIMTERTAVLDAIRTERKAVLDAVRAERMATLATTDSMAQRSIDHAFAAASRLLLWIFLGLRVLAIVGAIGAASAVRALRS